jgi:hypothetical protein
VRIVLRSDMQVLVLVVLLVTLNDHRFAIELVSD